MGSSCSRSSEVVAVAEFTSEQQFNILAETFLLKEKVEVQKSEQIFQKVTSFADLKQNTFWRCDAVMEGPFPVTTGADMVPETVYHNGIKKDTFVLQLDNKNSWNVKKDSNSEAPKDYEFADGDTTKIVAKRDLRYAVRVTQSLIDLMALEKDTSTGMYSFPAPHSWSAGAINMKINDVLIIENIVGGMPQGVVTFYIVEQEAFGRLYMSGALPMR